MTPRLRRALKMVDELELDPGEIRALRDELGTREECVVDLEGATDEERASLLTIKRRIDAFYRGETKTLTMAEGNAMVKEELRRRRGGAAAPRAAARPSPRRTG